MVRTQVPELRITRWLRRYDRQPIPFEGECTACANAQFKIKHDKRSTYWAYGELPESNDYAKKLQDMFEEHLRVAHMAKSPAPASE